MSVLKAEMARLEENKSETQRRVIEVGKRAGIEKEKIGCRRNNAQRQKGAGS